MSYWRKSKCKGYFSLNELVYLFYFKIFTDYLPLFCFCHCSSLWLRRSRRGPHILYYCHSLAHYVNSTYGDHHWCFVFCRICCFKSYICRATECFFLCVWLLLYVNTLYCIQWLCVSYVCVSVFLLWLCMNAEKADNKSQLLSICNFTFYFKSKWELETISFETLSMTLTKT